MSETHVRARGRVFSPDDERRLLGVAPAAPFERTETHMIGWYAPLSTGREPSFDDFRPCTVVSLSAQGAAVMTNTPLPVGSPVRLVVPRLDEAPDPFGADARVVEMAPGAFPNSTEWVLAFAPLDPKARRRIESFLDRAARRSARHVAVSGTFNGWSVTSHRLSDPDGDGVWTAEVTLTPGVYQYKFFVDEEWRIDPMNPHRAPNLLGGENSVLDISDPSSDAPHPHTFRLYLGKAAKV